MWNARTLEIQKGSQKERVQVLLSNIEELFILIALFSNNNGSQNAKTFYHNITFKLESKQDKLYNCESKIFFDTGNISNIYL